MWVTCSFDVLICSSILQTFEHTTEHQAYKIFLLETENRVMTERIQQLEEANKVCGLCRKRWSESSGVELEGWMRGARCGRMGGVSILATSTAQNLTIQFVQATLS